MVSEKILKQVALDSNISEGVLVIIGDSEKGNDFRINDSTLKAIQNWFQTDKEFVTLIELEVSHVGLTDEEALHNDVPLTPSKNLNFMTDNNNAIGNTFIIKQKNREPNLKIQVLFNFFSKNLYLKKLNLKGNNLSDFELSLILNFLASHNFELRELDISFNQIGEESVKALIKLLAKTRLGFQKVIALNAFYEESILQFFNLFKNMGNLPVINQFFTGVIKTRVGVEIKKEKIYQAWLPLKSSIRFFDFSKFYPQMFESINFCAEKEQRRKKLLSENYVINLAIHAINSKDNELLDLILRQNCSLEQHWSDYLYYLDHLEGRAFSSYAKIELIKNFAAYKEVMMPGYTSLTHRLHHDQVKELSLPVNEKSSMRFGFYNKDCFYVFSDKMRIVDQSIFELLYKRQSDNNNTFISSERSILPQPLYSKYFFAADPQRELLLEKQSERLIALGNKTGPEKIFEVLGINQIDFFKEMLLLKHVEDIRKTLANEILYAYKQYLNGMGGIAPHSLAEWMKMVEENERAYANLNFYINFIKSTMPETKKLTLNEMIGWLHQKGCSFEKEHLIAKQNSYIKTKEVMINFCESEVAYIHYCKSFSAKENISFIGFSSIISYAKVKNISVYVWDRIEGTPYLFLKESYSSKLQSKNKMIHLLFEGFSQFSILEKIPSQNIDSSVLQKESKAYNYYLLKEKRNKILEFFNNKPENPFSLDEETFKIIADLAHIDFVVWGNSQKFNNLLVPCFENFSTDSNKESIQHFLYSKTEKKLYLLKKELNTLDKKIVLKWFLHDQDFLQDENNFGCYEEFFDLISKNLTINLLPEDLVHLKGYEFNISNRNHYLRNQFICLAMLLLIVEIRKTLGKRVKSMINNLLYPENSYYTNTILEREITKFKDFLSSKQLVENMCVSIHTLNSLLDPSRLESEKQTFEDAEARLKKTHESHLNFMKRSHDLVQAWSNLQKQGRLPDDYLKEEEDFIADFLSSAFNINQIFGGMEKETLLLYAFKKKNINAVKLLLQREASPFTIINSKTVFNLDFSENQMCFSVLFEFLKSEMDSFHSFYGVNVDGEALKLIEAIKLHVVDYLERRIQLVNKTFLQSIPFFGAFFSPLPADRITQAAKIQTEILEINQPDEKVILTVLEKIGQTSWEARRGILCRSELHERLLDLIKELNELKSIMNMRYWPKK